MDNSLERKAELAAERLIEEIEASQRTEAEAPVHPLWYDILEHPDGWHESVAVTKIPRIKQGSRARHDGSILNCSTCWNTKLAEYKKLGGN